MKKAVVILFSVGVCLLSATNAMGLDPNELNHITFTNDTGYEIEHLFFSPGDSDYWGADILGSERTIGDGEEVSYYIHYPDKKDKFDFLAVDSDGDSYEIRGMVVSDGKEATVDFTANDLADKNYKLNYAQVSFDNSTGEELYYCFFSPGDSKYYGIDMLDDQTTLLDGDSLTLLVPVSSKKESYDFIGVTESGDEYSFSISINNAKDSYEYSIDASDKN